MIRKEAQECLQENFSFGRKTNLALVIDARMLIADPSASITQFTIDCHNVIYAARLLVCY